VRGRLLVLSLCAAACAAPLPPLPATPTSATPEDAAALAAEARAAARQTQHEPSGDARRALTEKAVAAGQRCEQVAPESPLCDYALALALGVQARERHSTATQGLPLMVELLKRANGNDPRQDKAGAARVLALVLVRAPGWPLGPGDSDAGLKAARQAVALFPDYAPNQLALSEALLATGDAAGSRAAANRGLELGRLAVSHGGEQDANDWVRDGETLLAGKPPH
jgi:hypothetical protein